MKELIEHLERIAKANKDSFRYYIDVIPKRDKVELILNVEEIYDDHTFLRMKIDNLENTGILTDNLRDCCMVWGYEYVN